MAKMATMMITMNLTMTMMITTMTVNKKVESQKVLQVKCGYTALPMELLKVWTACSMDPKNCTFH